jgi:carboxymethylenebutenolidase
MRRHHTDFLIQKARRVTNRFQTLRRPWSRVSEEHIRHDFDTRSTAGTIATMVEHAYVDHVPVMTGGLGEAELTNFYSTHFIPKMAHDMQIIHVWHTIRSDRLVEELFFKCSRNIEMDWIFPGVLEKSH